MMVVYTVTGLFQHYYFATVLTILEFLLLLGGIALIHFRKYKLAFHIEMVTGMLFLFGISMIFGNSAENQMFFLFFPVVSIILFDKYSIITFYFILSMALLAATQILFEYYNPYYPQAVINDVFGVINPVFTGLLIFLGVKLFKTENIAFTQEISVQKIQLEEKNKDITDSIHYAKRIQRALFASDSLMQKNLPEHFIFYKPKDIVSGDFYWAEKKDSGFMLAVCDCTGHGVPGAFMSLLGVSFLNEIAKGRNISKPDEVLNQLREEIIRAMNPEGTYSGKDGMDAVLCRFNFEKMELSFAGANNPLWIVRNNILEEHETDNFPIGMHEGEIKPFTLRSAKIEKGNMIYLCTDGYSDQFGGPKGKKFKPKQLKDLLASVSKEPLTEQKKLLENKFNEWKKELEQVDDVLLIGIRV